MSSQIFLLKSKESTLFARNAITEDQDKCHEIKFFRKSSDAAIETTDGGLEVSSNILYDFIIQKLSEQKFGGDFGANENNVAVGVSWQSKEATTYKLKPADIVR